jgi:hypothetical protein
MVLVDLGKRVKVYRESAICLIVNICDPVSTYFFRWTRVAN